MSDTIDVLDPARIAARVQRGIDALDRYMPGWPSKIDTKKLEMESCLECVMGQLFKDYWRQPGELLGLPEKILDKDGSYDIFANLAYENAFDSLNSDHGFYPESNRLGQIKLEFVALNSEWIDRIKEKCIQQGLENIFRAMP